jgi:hypothetical protein
MTYLSRLAKLGGAKEGTPPANGVATYAAPTFSIPFNTAQYTNTVDPLKDTSFRATDTVLQAIQQGVRFSAWEIESNGYPDLMGYWFRAMIGPDSVTAGISTTLSVNSAANATSLSFTASPGSNATVKIADAAGVNSEYVQIGTITGSNPYVAPVVVGGGTGGTSTKYAHTAAGGSVTTPTTHLFQQNRTFSTVWPTYSLTTDDGPTGDQLGWPGQVCSDLSIKLDPKAYVTIAPKFLGFPAQSESTFSYAASNAQSLVGWGWTVQNAGASSTRGMTMDISLKRAVEAIPASTGTQAPREIFPGALECDASYKAIFENQLDMNLYEQATQEPTVCTVTQPVLSGGAVLAITLTSSGYTTGKRELGGEYVQASFDLSGITNATDSSLGGVAQVSLQNWVTAGY